MSKSKIYKISAVIILTLFVAAAIFYYQLPNRHKAIVKTTLLHKLHLVDNQWEIENARQDYKMISPAFLIDGIYRSMEGPKASNFVQLSQDSTLLWLTGFEVKALDSKTKAVISKDFICHTNVDFNDVKYYSSLGLDDRIGKQYPRMATLSHGLEEFSFPEGYGVPMKGDNLLYVTSQSLNHNLPKANILVKHEVTINYLKGRTPLKPLMCRTAFIMLPYNKDDPFKEPVDKGSDMCIPVETKNHSYDDGKGNKMTGHWIIPPGKKIYRSPVNAQLLITDSLRLHAAAVHVHPFSVKISLIDKTENAVVYESNITNHTQKTGLSNIEQFSSIEGSWMYRDHDYELVLETNNTTGNQQEMMGSMSLFFYDQELDLKLKK